VVARSLGEVFDEAANLILTCYPTHSTLRVPTKSGFVSEPMCQIANKATMTRVTANDDHYPRIGEHPAGAIRTQNIPPPAAACGQRAAKSGAHGKRQSVLRITSGC